MLATKTPVYHQTLQKRYMGMNSCGPVISAQVVHRSAPGWAEIVHRSLRRAGDRCPARVIAELARSRERR